MLHNIVEVLALTQFDVPVMLGVVVLDRRHVGTTLVDGDLLGLPVQRNGLLQETSSGGSIALGSEQQIDRIAFAIHRTIQILPTYGPL